MTEWHADDIVSNGISIHYTRTGGPKPPVVLAHGFSDDGLCWTPVAERLAPDYDVIMVDARGHGRSDAPERGYTPIDHAADLAGVIRGLELQKPAILGHSMGGSTAFVLAGLYPELPGAILIEDSAARDFLTGDSAEDQEKRRLRRERMIRLKSQSRDELIEMARVDTPSWPDAELGPWADAKLRFSIHALNRQSPHEVHWEQVLGNIVCPALLLTADPELGASVTAERAVQIRELVPQLRVVHISGAGHNIRREQPDRYMEAVCSFLTQEYRRA